MAESAQGDGNWYWTGSLSLPTALTSLGVSGLWLDAGKFNPGLAAAGIGYAADLPQGWQSLGNASTTAQRAFPQTLGASYYNLPLGGSVPTGAIGLVEPGVGTACSGDNQGSGFPAALDAYRATAGVPTGTSAIAVAGGGQVLWRPCRAIQLGRRALARCRHRGDRGAQQPARALCRLGQHPRRQRHSLHRLSVGDLGYRQQPAGPELVVQLYSLGGARLAVLPGGQRSCGPTWRCATSRCSATWAIGGSGNSFGNGLTNGNTSREQRLCQ